MMTYLYIFMNRQGLDKVIGFLVQLDGNVRAYRACREPDIIYEENETFKVQHIVGVLHELLNH